MRVLFLAILAVFLSASAVLFSSCAAPLAPAGNALSVYDIYSVARDRRSVSEVLATSSSRLKSKAKFYLPKALAAGIWRSNASTARSISSGC